MRRIVLLGFLGSAAVYMLSACPATQANGFGDGGGGSTSSGTGKSSSSGSAASSTSGGVNFSGSSSTGSGSSSSGVGVVCNSTAPGNDNDGDGWTVAQGDCNDCDKNINPGAVDVVPVAGADGGIPAEVHSDCAAVFDPPQPCDDALAIDSADPYDAAKAIELCQKQSDPKKWGVKSATWVLPDGTTTATTWDQNNPFQAGSPLPIATSQNYHLGHGNLSAFGPNNVQYGKRMLGLSSGTARQPNDPGYQDVSGFDKGFVSGSPMGFPKESAACPGTKTGQPHDGVALEVVIHTPSNATGFSFVFNFFTFEWPDWICSTYNDFFVALLSPIPNGQTDGNISFDTMKNPVSVNNAFLEVCGCSGGPPCQAGALGNSQKSFPCMLGNSSLQGTGFGGSMDSDSQDHGSTDWLQTTTSVAPNTDITMRWTVYDSSDGNLDTTTLVDGFAWIADPGIAASPPVTMVAMPPPK